MSRQAKRKAATIRVPHLEEDAAERKRLLNVLAQRRYRDRKRDHLKKLELQVESNSSPSPVQTTAERTVPSTSDHTGSPGCQANRAVQQPPVLAAAPEAAPVNSEPIFLDNFDSSFDLSSGWMPEAFDTSLQAWPTAIFLPSLPGVPTDISSTNDASSQNNSAQDTTPSSLSSVDWPLLQDMDFTSALQTTSTRSYSFPDERYTSILELKLLRGCMMIAKRMNIEDLLWSLDSTSPFTDPTLSGLTFDHLPANLRPTKTQQLIPHHPLLDILAWPSVRDKLIMVFSQELDVRPPIAASPTALLDLVYDIEDSAEGVRIWGENPCTAENWEVGEAVFKKWWWALDSKIIEKSNEWRRGRGAPLLGSREGFVISEE